MSFQRMLNDTISLVKADGQRIDGINALVQSGSIFIGDALLPAEDGDRIVRTLPNGLIEEYVILDTGYKSGMGGIQPHFQMKVQKQAGPNIPEDSTMAATSQDEYVDKLRLDQLRAIRSDQFDLTKLIALCEELNRCYASNCYFAIAMLTRAILDHVPPVFEYDRFSQVANNYQGSRSFKASMQHLEHSSRKVADAHLHTVIRSRETIPSRVQVDFKNDLDVLLSEVVRLLK